MSAPITGHTVSRLDPAGQPARPLREWPAEAWQRRGRPHFQLQLALLAACLGALIGFGKVAEDYLDHDAITRWDVSFSRWLHDHSSSGLLSLFKLLTYAGNVAFLAVVTVAIAV